MNKMTSGKKQKNKEKKIKNSPKCSLESPFPQSLPLIEKKFCYEVKNLFKSSLSRALPVDGNELKTKKTAATRYVTFGFNAVMRGLEQNKIKCVFVKEEAKPDLLLRSFLHVCYLKAVPLIPLKGLSDVVKELVGIKSALAIGLKSHECENGGIFADLYHKCCATLAISPPLKSSEKVAAKSVTRSFKDVICEKKTRGTFHLIIQNKFERVFKPPKAVLCVYPDTRKPTISVKKNASPGIDLSMNKKKFVEEPLLDTSDISFFIDLGNQENGNLISQEDTQEKDSSMGKDSFNENPTKNESKKRANKFSYVSTRIKRTKGNPNRRS